MNHPTPDIYYIVVLRSLVTGVNQEFSFGGLDEAFTFAWAAEKARHTYVKNVWHVRDGNHGYTAWESRVAHVYMERSANSDVALVPARTFCSRCRRDFTVDTGRYEFHRLTTMPGARFCSRECACTEAAAHNYPVID